MKSVQLLSWLLARSGSLINRRIELKANWKSRSTWFLKLQGENDNWAPHLFNNIVIIFLLTSVINNQPSCSPLKFIVLGFYRNNKSYYWKDSDVWTVWSILDKRFFETLDSGPPHFKGDLLLFNFVDELVLHV